MRQKIRWIGAAARVWTDAPVAALFLFGVLAYLVLCLAVYPASQRP